MQTVLTGRIAYRLRQSVTMPTNETGSHPAVQERIQEIA